MKVFWIALFATTIATSAQGSSESAPASDNKKLCSDYAKSVEVLQSELYGLKSATDLNGRDKPSLMELESIHDKYQAQIMLLDGIKKMVDRYQRFKGSIEGANIPGDWFEPDLDAYGELNEALELANRTTTLGAQLLAVDQSLDLIEAAMESDISFGKNESTQERIAKLKDKIRDNCQICRELALKGEKDLDNFVATYVRAYGDEGVQDRKELIKDLRRQLDSAWDSKFEKIAVIQNHLTVNKVKEMARSLNTPKNGKLPVERCLERQFAGVIEQDSCEEIRGKIKHMAKETEKLFTGIKNKDFIKDEDFSSAFADYLTDRETNVLSSLHETSSIYNKAFGFDRAAVDEYMSTPKSDREKLKRRHPGKRLSYQIADMHILKVGLKRRLKNDQNFRQKKADIFNEIRKKMNHSGPQVGQNLTARANDHLLGLFDDKCKPLPAPDNRITACHIFKDDGEFNHKAFADFMEMLDQEGNGDFLEEKLKQAQDKLSKVKAAVDGIKATSDFADLQKLKQHALSMAKLKCEQKAQAEPAKWNFTPDKIAGSCAGSSMTENAIHALTINGKKILEHMETADDFGGLAHYSKVNNSCSRIKKENMEPHLKALCDAVLRGYESNKVINQENAKLRDELNNYVIIRDESGNVIHKQRRPSTFNLALKGIGESFMQNNVPGMIVGNMYMKDRIDYTTWAMKQQLEMQAFYNSMWSSPAYQDWMYGSANNTGFFGGPAQYFNPSFLPGSSSTGFDFSTSGTNFGTSATSGTSTPGTVNSGFNFQ